MKVSKYAQELLVGLTCCHSVGLTKDGKTFVGIYNELSHWGRIEDGEGEFVEELSSEMEVDEDGSQYQSNFSEKSFIYLGGYELMK